MGRTAHVPVGGTPDRFLAADTDGLIGTVEELAEDPPGDRAAIEEALTLGYAQALSLEAERMRLDRRITALAAGLVCEGAGARVSCCGCGSLRLRGRRRSRRRQRRRW
jgi:hypothetical protein